MCSLLTKRQEQIVTDVSIAMMFSHNDKKDLATMFASRSRPCGLALIGSTGSVECSIRLQIVLPRCH